MLEPVEDLPPFRQRFVTLWAAGSLSAVAVLPYAFTLQQKALEAVAQPLPVIALASAAQSAVLMAMAVFVGLRAADAVGLRTPLTNALAARRGITAAVKTLGIPAAVGVGVVAAGIIIALDEVLFRPLLPEFYQAATRVSPSRLLGFLASFYGGIGEEILTRLFLVSVLAWLLRGRATWLAILCAALLFGAGHLPAAAAISPLTTALVVRTLLLNAVGGIAFGWLYWRRGLEAGMAAHFAADIVLHVLLTI